MSKAQASKETLNFEESLARLKENRAKLNQSDSFDEITKLWETIKQDYANCKSILDQVSQEIQFPKEAKIEAEMKFAKALEKMKQLSDNVKIGRAHV